ncbi:DNA replication/repair protein RecF [Simiduia aestuariiviva]|uniref:DNA replication and repair protein RecF n=1 Tax=Simiduia aestuariiviva TaxID=1510459 RepID=A0A839UWI2_9GAMM|nr:DNA replication/repair protein RecF [Simiduia aestuariiviva]MBB3169818.1 DNA replication and repair protein RecF [Simiduia aestuariiviva]
MPLESLNIQNFRNISDCALVLHANVNLFFGTNGAGKTSVLEAVSLLGRGRSFRSHKLKPLIQQGQTAVTVFGKYTDSAQGQVRIGVERTQRGADQFRVNGKPVSSASELAQVMPLQTIFSETFALLTGGPGERRQFLDWLVFHVEHQFMPAWRQVRQALKQRNSLLRSGRITADLLAPWDVELSRQGELLDKLRCRVFHELKAELLTLLAPIPVYKDLEIEYQRGWSSDIALADALVEQRTRDLQLGHTSIGPHRADLKIRLGKLSAEDVLSRGQQKLLVCALRISAARVFQRASDRKCAFLIDDLPSELDTDNRRRLGEWLIALGGQVFVTGVDQQDLDSTWQELSVPRKVFHVEHGQVTECEQNNV